MGHHSTGDGSGYSPRRSRSPRSVGELHVAGGTTSPRSVDASLVTDWLLRVATSASQPRMRRYE